MDKEKKDLIIVESPTQAKSVQFIVGDQFNVVATKGHILRTDLKNSKPGKENDFSVRLTFKNQDMLNTIFQAARETDKIYIATDPDEEGEAIAWHLDYLLQRMNAKIYRVNFTEITAAQIKESLKSPVPINPALVDAQKARSVIDQIIGTQLSPVLTRFNPDVRSAGRVQSAALILLNENIHLEYPVNSPQSETVKLSFKPNQFLQGQFCVHKLFSDSKEVSMANFETELLNRIQEDLFTVSELSIIPGQDSPKGYLSTSRLLQEGIRRFNRTGRQIMKTAQQLFEGIEPKNNKWLNLITYPRTDSVSISAEFQEKLKHYLFQNGIKFNGNKSPATIENQIHSAILPVEFSSERTPLALKSKLSRSHFELYNMIWNWSLGTALYGTGRMDKMVRLQGEKFHLWLKQDLLNTDSGVEYRDTALMPDEALFQIEEINTNRETDSDNINFDEASLIKILEENGIGRPSTYAEIVPRLLNRKYIVLNSNHILITELGREVAKILSNEFAPVTGIPVSKRLESDLGKIASNKIKFLPVVQQFKQTLDKSIAQFNAQSVDCLADNQKICSVCGEPLIKRRNRTGIYFICRKHSDQI